MQCNRIANAVRTHRKSSAKRECIEIAAQSQRNRSAITAQSQRNRSAIAAQLQRERIRNAADKNAI
jgi:hypothetical protein